MLVSTYLFAVLRPRIFEIHSSDPKGNLRQPGLSPETLQSCPETAGALTAEPSTAHKSATASSIMATMGDLLFAILTIAMTCTSHTQALKNDHDNTVQDRNRLFCPAAKISGSSMGSAPWPSGGCARANWPSFWSGELSGYRHLSDGTGQRLGLNCFKMRSGRIHVIKTTTHGFLQAVRPQASYSDGVKKRRCRTECRLASSRSPYQHCPHEMGRGHMIAPAAKPQSPRSCGLGYRVRSIGRKLTCSSSFLIEKIQPKTLNICRWYWQTHRHGSRY